MNTSLYLGKVWNIPIKLHLSWFIIFGLMTISLSTGLIPEDTPGYSVVTATALAVLTSILFFASVLAHELGHSLVALRESIPIKGITLFIFGGVAEIEREPKSAGAEFRIAIAGPLVSLGLAGAFGGLYLAGQAFPFLAAPSYWLARINLILAIFNMIPGFPMDGGRVLRAIVWQRTGNELRATRVAATLGRVVAFGFIGFGLFSILQGAFMNGLWLILISTFLQNAASSSLYAVKIKSALQDVTVEQVMSRIYPLVSPNTSLRQLVEERVRTTGQRTFYIEDEDGIPQGVLKLEQILAIPNHKWPFITVERVMTPLSDITTVTPQTELINALQSMESANLSQVPVLEQNQLIGVLSREKVMSLVQARSRLGA